MAAQRLFSVVGAGWTGALLYNNGDAARELLSSVGRSALQTLAKSPAAAPSGSGGDAAALQALAAQVAYLSALLSTRGDAGSGKGLTLPLAAGGVGVLAILHVRGSLADILYVTRGQFRRGVATIGASLGSLHAQLARAKQLLTEKLDLLTGRVDGVAAAQAALADEISATRGDIDELGSSLARLEHKTDAGNRGIFMLCHAVSALFQDSKAELAAPQKQELAAILQAGAPHVRHATLEETLAGISLLARSVESA
jgi:hypothetical protein